MASRVEISCLGGFSLEIDGIPVPRWRAGKARVLFQYLLVNRGRLVPADRLREVLWPGTQSSQQSTSLKVAVHAVRKVLAELFGRTGEQAITIVQDRGGYVLTTSVVDIDVEQVEYYARRARSAERDGHQRQSLLLHRRTVDLYTGDFLPGETSDWVVEHREWLRATVLHSLRVLREQALRAGDYLDVLAMCRRILDLDPYAEDAYQSLMVLHARRGELGRVRSWYDLCEGRLASQLDVEPSSRTKGILIGAMRGEFAGRRTA